MIQLRSLTVDSKQGQLAISSVDIATLARSVRKHESRRRKEGHSVLPTAIWGERCQVFKSFQTRRRLSATEDANFDRPLKNDPTQIRPPTTPTRAHDSPRTAQRTTGVLHFDFTGLCTANAGTSRRSYVVCICCHTFSCQCRVDTCCPDNTTEHTSAARVESRTENSRDDHDAGSRTDSYLDCPVAVRETRLCLYHRELHSLDF
jgi:hypothetical protein